MELLLARGAVVDQKDAWGWTALMAAANSGAVAAARALLGGGATVSAVDSTGAQALHRAVAMGSNSLAVSSLERREKDFAAMGALLLQHGASLDAQDGKGRAPFASVPAGQERQAIQMLVEALRNERSKDCHCPPQADMEEIHPDVAWDISEDPIEDSDFTSNPFSQAAVTLAEPLSKANPFTKEGMKGPRSADELQGWIAAAQAWLMDPIEDSDFTSNPFTQAAETPLKPLLQANPFRKESMKGLRAADEMQKWLADAQAWLVDPLEDSDFTSNPFAHALETPLGPLLKTNPSSSMEHRIKCMLG